MPLTTTGIQLCCREPRDWFVDHYLWIFTALTGIDVEFLSAALLVKPSAGEIKPYAASRPR